MSVSSLQARLQRMGFNPGPIDGVYGPSTERAINLALDKLDVAPEPPVVVTGPIPVTWLPWAQMRGIIFHWTAGANKASANDKEHYHILIEGDGKLIRGDPSITFNDAPLKPGYAAHTLGCNSDFIGVSLCGMAGAKESPFHAGDYPITKDQWQKLAEVLAQLCQRYAIPVTGKTVLSHAEVQPTLGIKQRGKWDIARLPWDASLKGPIEIGNQMRAMVKSRL